MDITVKKGTASSDVLQAISSKSYVHRLLIAAGLCDSKISVDTNIISNDMQATKDALGVIKAGGADPVIDAKESGSTARFLLPLAALLCDRATMTGSGKLPERPMGPLCDVLRAAGVSVSADHLPIIVSGRPHPGNYRIAGNVSSQFISGLLFMLPLLEGDSLLTVTGTLESASYVEMTLDVLDRFGIVIQKCADGFSIPGGQKYRLADGADQTIRAEGDWSNGAYIMAIAALASGTLFDSFTVSGLNPDSLQGDRAIVDILGQFGSDVKIVRGRDAFSSRIVISSPPVNPVEVDCSQIPDLVPALAVLAAYSGSVCTFYNVERLRLKECDRIEAVSEMLAAVNVEVDITLHDGHEDMCVHGRSMHDPACHPTEPVRIRSFNDHRIVMAATALSVAGNCPVTIEQAEAVRKSYPGFFDDVKKMGVDICDQQI